MVKHELFAIILGDVKCLIQLLVEKIFLNAKAFDLLFLTTILSVVQLNVYIAILFIKQNKTTWDCDLITMKHSKCCLENKKE